MIRREGLVPVCPSFTFSSTLPSFSAYRGRWRLTTDLSSSSLSLSLSLRGRFKIGVHIADVASFIPPYSDLDKEAGTRSTSVYLVQRVIPMLPSLLCEELCSLNPGVDRFAFSVVWELEMDEEDEAAPVVIKVRLQKAPAFYESFYRPSMGVSWCCGSNPRLIPS